jgi:hypothetical protein
MNVRFKWFSNYKKKSNGVLKYFPWCDVIIDGGCGKIL